MESMASATRPGPGCRNHRNAGGCSPIDDQSLRVTDLGAIVAGSVGSAVAAMPLLDTY